MSSSKTFDWTQFFKDSGLAVPLAKRYASLFEDNRISKDMLLDLNKEILSEIGITAMGDVINILKHAKKVHVQEQKRKERDSLISSTAASSSSKRLSMTSPHSTTSSAHKMPVVSTTSSIASTRKKAVKRVKNDSDGGRDMEVAYIAYVEPTEKEVLLEQHPMSRSAAAYGVMGNSDLDSRDSYNEQVGVDVTESYAMTRYDGGVKMVRGKLYSDDLLAEEKRAQTSNQQQARVIMLPGEGRDIFTTKALQKAAKVYESGGVQEGVLNTEKSRRLLESAGLIPADIDPEPSSVFSRLDRKSPSTTTLPTISYASSPPGVTALPQQTHRRIIQLSKSPSTRSGLYSDRSTDLAPSVKKRVIAIQSTSDSTTGSPPKRKVVSQQATRSKTLYSDSVEDNNVSSSVQAVKKRVVANSRKTSNSAAGFRKLREKPSPLDSYTVTVRGKMASDAPSPSLSMRLGLANNREDKRASSQPATFSRLALGGRGKTRSRTGDYSMTLSKSRSKSTPKQHPVMVSEISQRTGVFGYEDISSEPEPVRPATRERTHSHSQTMVADEYEYQSLRQRDIRSRLEKREREKAARRGGPLAGRLGTHEVFMRLE